MKPFSVQKILLFVGLLMLCVSCQIGELEKDLRPNIIFILADDLGWADLPVYGNKFNETPNLQRLAKEGMVFTNAYAACPVCSPTRASIQSGQYPARVGVIDFIPGHWRPYEQLTVPQNRTQYLPLEIESLGEMMKGAGYRTGYFGKWHLGNSQTHGPDKQGYDESVVYNGGGYYGYGKRMYPPQDFPQGKVLSEALTDLSLDFIEKSKEEPFFLFLAHYDVHVQLDADTAMIEKYMDKEILEDYPCNVVYAAMVENIDISVGRIMEKLKALDKSDQTMVIFFSDNGGLVSRFDKIPLHSNSKLYIYGPDSMQYIATSNAPLRAEKGTVYEGGIREPMIVKWPGRIKPGTFSDDIISSVDFFPTLAEIVGAEMPAAQVFDGKSIVDELRGAPVENDRAIYWHYPVYHHAVPASAVRKGDWKLIHFLDDDHVELYNLAADIGEKTDLSSERPAKAQELMTALEKWRKNAGAEMPKPNPDFDASRRDEWGRHPSRQ